MPRVAIFVDAGYLFAQGSFALTGDKQPRASLGLNVAQAFDALMKTTREQGILQPLLRVYWYDGARGSASLPLDHAEIAHTPFVKLRLGMINGAGQQKGVDSLIVTDLIELARNRAIDDAVLLSGDDDVRVGVTIAQTFGVCVHLIGIAPSIGSQSPLLLQEADTTTEWDAAVVGQFLSLKAPLTRPGATGPADAVMAGAGQSGDSSVLPEARRSLNRAIGSYFDALSPHVPDEIMKFWSLGKFGIPPDVDRQLLATCRSAIKRNLDPDETRYMRDYFAKLVREHKAAPGPAEEPK